MRILVTYASRQGSTAQIAMAIGKELQSAGYAVDVVEIKALVSPGDYHAVVIGGPLSMGKVVSEVGKFVSRHAKELGRLPIAVFTVGTSIVNGNPEAALNAQKSLRNAVESLIPVAEIAFSGKLDQNKPFVLPEEDNRNGESPCS